MKATGIVRRIDDLGRVVIPKEIRRTLHIREGEPMEIFMGREGEIILKKYSPIEDLGSTAREFVQAMAQTLGCMCVFQIMIRLWRQEVPDNRIIRENLSVKNWRK